MSRAISPERQLAAQEYFSLLRDQALVAGEQGNYAISAALVVRAGGTELVAVGANTVFGSRDPSGHAEMNAIRLAREFAATRRPMDAHGLCENTSSGSIALRRAPHSERETVLFTTLEPCPMCTVCIITAGIKRVVIAAADPPSGSLAPERLRDLPPLWSELADALGLEVSFCQSENPEQADTYLSAALHKELIETFLASRERLDRALGSDGVLDLDAIGKRAATLADESL
ncbi:MAG TPA: nucleoside deaminase [Solirubrobacteraceae bacterium]|nr:nucleoside deaminase [Solirubrobacteraceae bacterium]